MTPPNVALYNWIHQAFDFRGRSTRSDYWWTRLFVFIVYFALLYMFVAGLGQDRAELLVEWLATQPKNLDDYDIGPLPSLSKFAITAGIVFAIFTLIPDISVSWRRFQDMGKPGWLHILFLFAGAFIPFSSVIQLVWFIFPGTQGANRYGPDKLNRDPNVF